MPSRFHLDPHSTEPIYRQLMEQVRRLVASNQLQPGEELPSVRTLAAAHAVNPMTISKAYALLESEGTLQRNRGAAMTVSPQAKGKSMRPDPLALIAPALEQVVEHARQLQLDPKTVIDALAQRFKNQRGKL